MSEGDDLESRLWRVLEEERLSDLPQYHREGFFDELPLYSRFAQVAFLEDQGPRRANAALLRFGLKFLDALVAYEVPRLPFLAALTLWDNPDDCLLVPQIFVCCGDVRERLGSGLVLQEGRSVFAARVAKILAAVDPAGRYQLLEDVSTVPGTSRAVIGNRRVPFPNMVRLETFKPRSAATRRRAR
jgi:hypothetical protein